MKALFLGACCTIGALVSGCIATTRGTLPAGRSAAVEAAVKVAEKMGMGAKRGPVDAVLSGEEMPYGRSLAVVPQADVYVWFGGPNGYKSQGALRLTPAGEGQVQYEGTFASGMSDPDPARLGALFLEFTHQQLRLDRGEQAPHANPTKSFGSYAGRSMLTPVAGFHYSIQGNPYAPVGSKAFNYLAVGLGDLVMVGLLTAAFLVDDDDTRSTLVIAGVSTGVGWRLLSLIGGIDIQEYNGLARTDFDLGAAVRSLESAPDR